MLRQHTEVTDLPVALAMARIFTYDILVDLESCLRLQIRFQFATHYTGKCILQLKAKFPGGSWVTVWIVELIAFWQVAIAVSKKSSWSAGRITLLACWYSTTIERKILPIVRCTRSIIELP